FKTFRASKITIRTFATTNLLTIPEVQDKINQNLQKPLLEKKDQVLML
ncbi:10794_t:CDS:1, partial [Entrophospora sp. SA101]